VVNFPERNISATLTPQRDLEKRLSSECSEGQSTSRGRRTPRVSSVAFIWVIHHLVMGGVGQNKTRPL